MLHLIYCDKYVLNTNLRKNITFYMHENMDKACILKYHETQISLSLDYKLKEKFQLHI